MEDRLKLDNGFFQVTIKPDAFALGEYFAGLDSQDQVRFMKGWVSDYETNKKANWCFQAADIASEINQCNSDGGASAYKQLILEYLEDLIEHIEPQKQED